MRFPTPTWKLLSFHHRLVNLYSAQERFRKFPPGDPLALTHSSAAREEEFAEASSSVMWSSDASCAVVDCNNKSLRDGSRRCVEHCIRPQDYAICSGCGGEFNGTHYVKSQQLRGRARKCKSCLGQDVAISGQMCEVAYCKSFDLRGNSRRCTIHCLGPSDYGMCSWCGNYLKGVHFTKDQQLRGENRVCRYCASSKTARVRSGQDLGRASLTGTPPFGVAGAGPSFIPDCVSSDSMNGDSLASSNVRAMIGAGVYSSLPLSDSAGRRFGGTSTTPTGGGSSKFGPANASNARVGGPRNVLDGTFAQRPQGAPQQSQQQLPNGRTMHVGGGGGGGVHQNYPTALRNVLGMNSGPNWQGDGPFGRMPGQPERRGEESVRAGGRPTGVDSAAASITPHQAEQLLQALAMSQGSGSGSSARDLQAAAAAAAASAAARSNDPTVTSKTLASTIALLQQLQLQMRSSGQTQSARSSMSSPAGPSPSTDSNFGDAPAMGGGAALPRQPQPFASTQSSRQVSSGDTPSLPAKADAGPPQGLVHHVAQPRRPTEPGRRPGAASGDPNSGSGGVGLQRRASGGAGGAAQDGSDCESDRVSLAGELFGLADWEDAVRGWVEEGGDGSTQRGSAQWAGRTTVPSVARASAAAAAAALDSPVVGVDTLEASMDLATSPKGAIDSGDTLTSRSVPRDARSPASGGTPSTATTFGGGPLSSAGMSLSMLRSDGQLYSRTNSHAFDISSPSLGSGRKKVTAPFDHMACSVDSGLPMRPAVIPIDASRGNRYNVAELGGSSGDFASRSLLVLGTQGGASDAGTSQALQGGAVPRDSVGVLASDSFHEGLSSSHVAGDDVSSARLGVRSRSFGSVSPEYAARVLGSELPVSDPDVVAGHEPDAPRSSMGSGRSGGHHGAIGSGRRARRSDGPLSSRSGDTGDASVDRSIEQVTGGLISAHGFPVSAPRLGSGNFDVFGEDGEGSDGSFRGDKGAVDAHTGAVDAAVGPPSVAASVSPQDVPTYLSRLPCSNSVDTGVTDDPASRTGDTTFTITDAMSRALHTLEREGLVNDGKLDDILRIGQIREKESTLPSSSDGVDLDPRALPDELARTSVVETSPQAASSSASLPSSVPSRAAREQVKQLLRVYHSTSDRDTAKKMEQLILSLL